MENFFAKINNTQTIFGISLALTSIVVMLMTRPKSIAEWFVGLISTIVSSICGGAAVIMYLGINNLASSWIGLLALGGIIFACGLPGWILVRWVFNFFEKNKELDISQIFKKFKK
jgi:hypothetical protein